MSNRRYRITEPVTSEVAEEKQPRSNKRWVWIVVAGLIGIVLITTGFTYAAASPAVCATCHEMDPHVETWQVSGHSKVGCASCHETPREWYQFPQLIGARASLLARDVGLHLSRSGDSSATPHDAMNSEIPDSTCLRCHNSNREITMRYGTLIDHDEHAERNNSCVSCHRFTGHPDPKVQRPLLMMSQCFTCHSRAEDAEAPGTCDTCHPDEFELAPESHAPLPEWKDTHGKAFIDATEDCAMCHDQAECDSCHGVEMPHPAAWNEGESTHGASALEDAATCLTCHPQVDEFCVACHHEGYEPADGPWTELHQLTAEEKGTAACLECHEPTHCVTCHRAYPPEGPAE